MLQIIRKNSAYLSIAIVLLLIVFSVSFSFYCKKIMAESLYLEAQASFINSNTYSIVSDRLQAVDNSVRSFGLTKTDEDLKYLGQGYNGLKEHVDRIFRKLEEQKKDVPQYALHIDTLQRMLKSTETKITEYYVSTNEMIELARLDSMVAFKRILSEQRGMVPWSEWYSLSNKTKEFEENLIAEAQGKYESVVEINAWIQMILLVLGLPTLFWTIGKLMREEKKRLQLLIDLDQNNRKYLFNSGVERQNFDANGQLNEANQHIQKSVDFINNIARGNYEVDWQGITKENITKNSQTLAGELLKMRDQMLAIKLEADHRNWANEGISALGEILRKNTDLQSVTDAFLSGLVKYINANQGAIFVINDVQSNDVHLELKSAFAYDRKKFIEKKILPGEGLAGQVWLEKETVFLTEIPDSYVQITSGTGAARPNSLLIVPIKNEDQIQGVLELASFKVFKEFEIRFVEKLAENLSLVLNSVKINEKTKALLEQSQKQGEEMRSQEEEMRQNMEELGATQEEMARKEQEYIKQIERLKANQKT